MDGIDLVLCAIDGSSCTLLHAQECPYHLGLKNEVLGIIQNPTTLKSIGEIDVVSDFRSANIANGGQGAPFAPAFHKFLFGKHEKNIVVVNIGGMANVTLLGERYLGWDCGCGNVLLDTLIQKAHNKSYDEEGALARSGEVNNGLLQAMLGDPYFTKQPPKSTGREYFNFAWLEHYLKDFIGLSDIDILSTLTELTALAIVNDTKIQTRSSFAVVVRKTLIFERGSHNSAK